MERKDNYLQRREHLKDLTDQQLKERFWSLLDQITTPLVELAHTHTSPAVERSVLLRMGFSSLDCKVIVERCIEHGLIGKGAGHVVLKVAESLGINYLEAGQRLIEDESLWEKAKALFGGER
ncbi:ornithine aminomutase subunit alpha [Anaerobranca gottschalkii]|uniref:D-ornithine 4,5-aminomutase S subunit n=1 Tax=Anaerobranca gottschalkii DSM 13577 TaxID=1120990 RepID=A0A1I0A492_9FIRM|nr:ornithine aminomutase subunit alpha [Anaerobranca gottschalkii]SES88973.1 D-ornithine 4,5-aminomutase S subunit [Anaerobranca gottschalkii DSM 13577]